MLEKYIFEVQGTRINLYTNINSVVEKLDKSARSILKTIPCKIKKEKKVNEIEDDENYITALSATEKSMTVNKDKNIIHMFSKDTDFRFPDLIYAMLGMLSNILKEKDEYLLHSAAVTNTDNNSILIMGDPGSGKSSIAFQLIRKYNYKLLSNDITIIKKEDSKLKIIGGTTSMQMRLGALKLYYPNDLEKIKKIEDIDYNKNEWDTKIYIDDILEDSNICTDCNTNVNKIFHISTASKMDFSIRNDEYIDNYLYIYEQLIRQIRNTRNLIVGYNYPLESFETQESNIKVSKLSEYIAKNIDIYDARGNIEEVAKRMVYLNEK